MNLCAMLRRFDFSNYLDSNLRSIIDSITVNTRKEGFHGKSSSVAYVQFLPLTGTQHWVHNLLGPVQNENGAGGLTFKAY